jgi:hypothetical protein
MKGEVTSVRAHHTDRNKVLVSVAHGKRKPRPKAKKGQPAFPNDYDDRAESTIAVSKRQAGQYGVGRRVDVGMRPTTDQSDEDLEGEDLDAMQKRLRKAQRS